jgi:predicted NUDIX family NTP pyrophosphohydrolase
MPTRSAGLLVYRKAADGIEVLLVHPGGPYWRRKDDGAWSIPKGEHDPDEESLDVAIREFREEVGVDPPDTAAAVPLGEHRQPSGKLVTAWAVEGDLDVSEIDSNTFEMEPRSGRTAEFPEVDRAGWFTPDEARRKLLRGQVVLLDRLAVLLDRDQND